MSSQPSSGEEDEQLSSQFRLDTLGEVFGVTTAVGIGLFILSFLGLFAFAVWSPDGAEMPLSHPIMVVGISSWVCVVVSAFSYVIWATRQLRKQPRDSDQPIRWDTDDPDPYGERERRIIVALGVGVFFLLIPLAIFGGADGS